MRKSYTAVILCLVLECLILSGCKAKKEGGSSSAKVGGASAASSQRGESGGGGSAGNPEPAASAGQGTGSRSSSAAASSKGSVHPAETVSKTEIKLQGGYPQLVINGKRTAPIFFTQWMNAVPGGYQKYPNYPESASYANIHLYCPRVNASALYQFAPYLDEIIEKDKDAKFILNLWVQNIGYYQLDNPADHTDTRSPGSASLDSAEWRKKAVEFVTQRVKSFMESDYADRIIGFALTAGMGGEWFDLSTYDSPSPDFDRSKGSLDSFRAWLANKYKTDAALRTAWADGKVTLKTADIPKKVTDGPFLDPKAHQNLIDYMNFHASSIADTIEAVCGAVKTASGNTRIAGVAYGYGMETYRFSNVAGTLAFDQVLRNKTTDFLFSPISYAHREMLDYTGWHGFADSVRRHGKLWISEDDTRTHLSTDPADAPFKTITSSAETLPVLWKNFMAAMTKRAGAWWYDNSGIGSLDDPNLMYGVKIMKALGDKIAGMDYKQTAEIAVVFDEVSPLYQTPGQMDSRNGYSFNEDMGRFRHYAGLIGATVDTVSFRDVVEGKANEYKLYIFANAFAMTASDRAAVNKLKSGGRTLLFTRTPGVIDIDTRSPSQSAVKALTGLDLTLARSSDNSKIPYGKGVADKIGSLTAKNISELFTGFTTAARPHMYAAAGSGDKVYAKAPDGKAVALLSPKQGWNAGFADDVSLLTPEVLRGVMKETGIHYYTDIDSTVNADNHFVAVTVKSGKANEPVYFKNASTVYDVVGDTEYKVSGGKITVNATSLRTYVFFLGTKSELQFTRPGK